MSPRRQLAAAAAILALLGARDFVTRIHVGRDDSLRGFTTPKVAAIAAPRPPEQLRQDLAAWLPALASAPVAADPNDPAAWDLRLAAVFEQRGQRVAVIMATPRGGGTPQRHRLTVGGTLNGFTVTGIERARVTLTGPSGPQELQMFRRRNGAPG